MRFIVATTKDSTRDLWLVFAANPVVLDAPKAARFNVLGEDYITPNKDLWRHFDQSGAHDYVYNRFSLVTVGLLPKGSPV